MLPSCVLLGRREGEQQVHHAEETYMLERTLKRIAGLLHVGFGEAGAQIIAQNMLRGGRVDASVDGTRVCGAFGFCDIRQFTDATECLQVSKRCRSPRRVCRCLRRSHSLRSSLFASVCRESPSVGCLCFAS